MAFYWHSSLPFASRETRQKAPLPAVYTYPQQYTISIFYRHSSGRAYAGRVGAQRRLQTRNFRAALMGVGGTRALAHSIWLHLLRGFSAYQSRRSASVVHLHPEKKRNVLMWVPDQSAIAGALPEKQLPFWNLNQKLLPLPLLFLSVPRFPFVDFSWTRYTRKLAGMKPMAKITARRSSHGK